MKYAVAGNVTVIYRNGVIIITYAVTASFCLLYLNKVIIANEDCYRYTLLLPRKGIKPLCTERHIN